MWMARDSCGVLPRDISPVQVLKVSRKNQMGKTLGSRQQPVCLSQDLRCYNLNAQIQPEFLHTAVLHPMQSFPTCPFHTDMGLVPTQENFSIENITKLILVPKKFYKQEIFFRQGCIFFFMTAFENLNIYTCTSAIELDLGNLGRLLHSITLPDAVSNISI